MEYKKLGFDRYFLYTSKDWRHSGKVSSIPVYNHVSYKRKFLGFINIKFSSEWECHYEADRNVIQVNFEQTHGWKDWIINLLFPAKMYDEFKYTDENGKEIQIQLKACKGWMQMYFVMKHQVREAVSNLLKKHPDAFVEVVGWSLGSSQAQYCAQDLNFNLGVKPYLYTYGSVKPWKGGNKVKRYLKQTCSGIYNFMHKSDIVTYMPPFFGYFAMNPVKLGKFGIFKIWNPQKWHTEYGEEYLYEKIK